MADVVHKTTFEYRSSVNTPDFPTADWLHNPAGLAGLLAGGVPTRHWKLNVAGDDVIEMTAPEKEAVDLPLRKIARLSELNEKLLNALDARQRSASDEPTIAAQIAAAPTVAAVDAIAIDFADPFAGGALVGDVLYSVLAAPGTAIAAGAWTKITGTTSVLGNSVGVSFDDGGESNRVRAAVGLRAEISAALSFEVQGAPADVLVTLARNGVAPTAGFIRGGLRRSGVLGDILGGCLAGPITMAPDDFFEVWMEVTGAGALVVPHYMQFWAKRIG